MVSDRLRGTKVIQSSKEVAQEIDARVMHGDHSEFLNVFFFLMLLNIFLSVYC